MAGRPDRPIDPRRPRGPVGRPPDLTREIDVPVVGPDGAAVSRSPRPKTSRAAREAAERARLDALDVRVARHRLRQIAAAPDRFPREDRALIRVFREAVEVARAGRP